ncbi:amidinotransferase [Phytoactinopolyspora sp. XMNu-373]|uniref:Amidinotransferase n=2 Tax=Phytoactinopolyspora mesophila TaxID=2650750 RepID=A0A7K3MBU7_9ACTN|nr:amidinotransferase [Phytoactinopolyspora mesophila]
MCPPTHFAVTYAINPWMDPGQPVDRDLAVAQWTTLREAYTGLGHRVDVIDPVPGLPDMVFTANGAFVLGRRALGARFREEVRTPEAPVHREWLTSRGFDVHVPQAINEGEGDLAWTGKHILVGTGFRSSPEALAEIASVFGVPVIALDLVDPRFYHLDTALTVLDEHTIAYFPPAFSAASCRQLDALYPDAIVVGEEDAMHLGLNATSDGQNVVMAAQAKKMADQLAERGFIPVPVDVSELLKAGGGVKCATLELHT